MQKGFQNPFKHDKEQDLYQHFDNDHGSDRTKKGWCTSIIIKWCGINMYHLLLHTCISSLGKETIFFFCNRPPPPKKQVEASRRQNN